MHVACVVYATGLNSEKVIVKSEKVEILGNEKYKIRAKVLKKCAELISKTVKTSLLKIIYTKLVKKTNGFLAILQIEDCRTSDYLMNS